MSCIQQAEQTPVCVCVCVRRFVSVSFSCLCKCISVVYLCLCFWSGLSRGAQVEKQAQTGDLILPVNTTAAVYWVISCSHLKAAGHMLITVQPLTAGYKVTTNTLNLSKQQFIDSLSNFLPSDSLYFRNAWCSLMWHFMMSDGVGIVWSRVSAPTWTEIAGGDLLLCTCRCTCAIKTLPFVLFRLTELNFSSSAVIYILCALTICCFNKCSKGARRKERKRKERRAKKEQLLLGFTVCTAVSPPLLSFPHSKMEKKWFSLHWEDMEQTNQRTGWGRGGISQR